MKEHCHTGNSNFRFEYLREIEAIFENTAACQSGAQMGRFSERSRDTVPLRLIQGGGGATLYTVYCGEWRALNGQQAR